MRKHLALPHLLCAAAATAVLALHACHPVPAASPTPADQPATGVAPDTSRAAQGQALQRAREAWARTGPRDYRYTVRRICYCGGNYTAPVTVTVRGGSTVSTTFAENGQPATGWETLSTVPALLDYVAATMARNPASLVARYDALGYPVEVRVDHALFVADDELSIVVSDFRAL